VRNPGLIAVVSEQVVGGPAGAHPDALYLVLAVSHIRENAEGVFVVDAGFENHPLARVTWFGAEAFCSYHGWRLPTEAEWEYACRAGTTTALYSGGLIEDECDPDVGLNGIGWYCGNSGGTSHPVREKAPNAFGLYDMAGNVNEWCADWYSPTYYMSSPIADPPGPMTGNFRVARGGDWDSFAKFCRSASRLWRPSMYTQTGTYGFRPARS
jgi:formylglycine-generating enzyme required for sulfatase activity